MTISAAARRSSPTGGCRRSPCTAAPCGSMSWRPRYAGCLLGRRTTSRYWSTRAGPSLGAICEETDVEHLQDRVAVVTGAASGLGLAMSNRFARAGMKVVLADIEADPLDAGLRAPRGAGPGPN